MTSNTIAQGILKAVGIIVGIVLLALALYKLQNIIIYIVLAAVVALIGRPIVGFLKRRLKFKNTWATVTTHCYNHEFSLRELSASLYRYLSHKGRT